MSSTLRALLEREREREERISIGELEVVLLNAKNLKDKGFLGKMDPYVLIRYGNKECKSKVAHGRGRNPKWNQRFTFKVGYTDDASDQQKISFTIMDKDIFSKDDFVGESTVFTKDVVSLGMENGTAELAPQKYRVVLANKKYYGEMSIGVKFTRN